MKKIISIAISIVLVFTMLFPFAAMAANTDTVYTSKTGDGWFVIVED